MDNGKVSFSNPVRQSLYTYTDCLNGGKTKAEAAAAMTEKIFPGKWKKMFQFDRQPDLEPILAGAKCVGVEMSVPMPGHVISEKMRNVVAGTVEHLDMLIKG